MVFYFLAIKHYVGFKKNARRFRLFNCSVEELVTHYIAPYNSNLSFSISGKKVTSSQIEQIFIFSSSSPILDDMLLSTGSKLGEEKHDVMINCLLNGECNAVDVTSQFLHPIKNKDPREIIIKKH
jgi:hypothetical protein